MHAPKLRTFYQKEGILEYTSIYLLDFKMLTYLLFNSKYSSLENIKEHPERFSLKDIHYDIVKGKKETQRE